MKRKFNLLVLSFLVAFTTTAQFEKRTNPAGYDSPAMKAIAYGLTAPSPHNSQSWFIDKLSDTELLLYVKHVLPETDPPARQIHIGAGCFIELLTIGMTTEGYETRVEYFPHGEYVIEKNKIADKPLAKITLIKNEAIQKDALFDYIYQRGTNRKPYTGKMITQDEFGQIKNLIGTASCEMIFMNDEAVMKPYLDIFSKAMAIETKTRATNEETREMFRFSEKERAEKKNGISIPQMGYDGMIRGIAEGSLKNGDSLIWHSESNFKATMSGINKGIYSSKGIILFKSYTNTMLDWVKCGRDYARFNVAIAKLRIVTHPYNQVIQEYSEMMDLQNEFNTLTKTSGEEKIQMIVRIGRAPSTYQSWRKNPEDYLIKY
ncbi:MAG: hypothetical protein WCK78_11455 [Paludibacter sp.]